MVEVIEIRRKEFEIVEKLGERSFKVSRNGKFYFLKKFENDKEGFDMVVENERRLKVSGILFPKLYVYDNKSRNMVMDYIEGENAFDVLLNRDLNEDEIKFLFQILWFSRNDHIKLDYHPHNFKILNGKIYYLAFKYSKFISNEEFLNNDYRYWMITKEFVQYAHSFGKDVDSSRILKDYDINKKMTLAAVKYFK